MRTKRYVLKLCSTLKGRLKTHTASAYVLPPPMRRFTKQRFVIRIIDVLEQQLSYGKRRSNMTRGGAEVGPFLVNNRNDRGIRRGAKCGAEPWLLAMNLQ